MPSRPAAQVGSNLKNEDCNLILIVILFETSGGRNGLCLASINTSWRVCVPGGSSIRVSSLACSEMKVGLVLWDLLVGNEWFIHINQQMMMAAVLKIVDRRAFGTTRLTLNG